MSELIRIFTVYDRPLDYPDLVVVRGHRVFADGRTVPDRMPCILVPAVDDARAILREMKLTCIPRDPNDDPKIVESWL